LPLANLDLVAGRRGGAPRRCLAGDDNVLPSTVTFTFGSLTSMTRVPSGVLTRRTVAAPQTPTPSNPSSKTAATSQPPRRDFGWRTRSSRARNQGSGVEAGWAHMGETLFQDAGRLGRRLKRVRGILAMQLLHESPPTSQGWKGLS